MVETVSQMHKDAKGQLWMDRPLPSSLLKYAANDIHAIRTLYDHFVYSGWLTDDCHHLIEASTRYLSLHLEPLDPGNIFKGGPFLPLDILTVLGGTSRRCEDCRRQISSDHFYVSVSTGIQYLSCRVCESMKVKVLKDAQRAAEKIVKAVKREEREKADAEAAAKAHAEAEKRKAARIETLAASQKEQADSCEYYLFTDHSITYSLSSVALITIAAARLNLSDPSPEELSHLGSIAAFMRQIRVPHFSRDTMKKHLQQSIPGYPFGTDDESLERIILRACTAGVLIAGGQNDRAWVRLAEHDDPDRCKKCKRGDR